MFSQLSYSSPIMAVSSFHQPSAKITALQLSPFFNLWDLLLVFSEVFFLVLPEDKFKFTGKEVGRYKMIYTCILYIYMSDHTYIYIYTYVTHVCILYIIYIYIWPPIQKGIQSHYNFRSRPLARPEDLSTADQNLHLVMRLGILWCFRNLDAKNARSLL